MILSTRLFTIIVTLLFCTTEARSQNAPIGSWESHLPYNSAIGLASDGNVLYTACNQAFFTLNTLKGDEQTPYSKTEGMADIGMKCVGYDMATSTAVLVYDNGNIDLFKDNTFYNIPDLKSKVTGGRKVVYQVYTENGFAYLSSTFGIIVIDLTNHNITKTMELAYNTPVLSNVVLPVTSFISSGNFFYAATDAGVYRVDKNNPRIQDFQVWRRTDSTNGIINITSVNNELFFSSRRSVFKLTNDTLQAIYTTSQVFKTRIRHIDGGNNKLLVSEFSDSTLNGSVKIIDLHYNLIDSFSFAGRPLQAAELLNNSIWVADSLNGLRQRTDVTQTNFRFPKGPSSPFCFDIYAHDRNVYLAHGGHSQLFGAYGSMHGVSYLHDNKWKLYKQSTFPKIGYTRDIVVLEKDENNGTLYAGSFLNGLVLLSPDEEVKLVDAGSIFDGSYTYGSSYHQVIGLDLDNDKNLWLTLMYSDHQLYLKTKDDEWFKFRVPDVSFGGPIVADDNGQLYFVSYLAGGAIAGGVAVYNTNGTLTDPADDVSYHLRTGKGFGNLPSNNTFCIAKDKNNEIWVGTDNGIGIIRDCKAPFTNSVPCDAVLPEVEYGKIPGPMFAGINVRSIAVDAANRKWVGTEDGVWLLSPDGLQILQRFTAENSPLPSNNVQKITIDHVTGDVYFGTYQGMVSYRSAITEAGTSNKDAFIFPSPVPAGYTGSIAIKGLITNSEILINDINGQLVFRTRVDAGGQAIWDGKDYKGHRPQTGVYLVFISGSDGKQTYAGKIVFMQ